MCRVTCVAFDCAGLCPSWLRHLPLIIIAPRWHALSCVSPPPSPLICRAPSHANETDLSPATFGWYVDTLPPSITLLVQPDLNSSTPQTSTRIVLTVDDTSPVTLTAQLYLITFPNATLGPSILSSLAAVPSPSGTVMQGVGWVLGNNSCNYTLVRACFRSGNVGLCCWLPAVALFLLAHVYGGAHVPLSVSSLNSVHV
jgi:hypothetical protein